MSDLRVYNSWKQKSPAFLRNKTNMKSLGTQRRKKEFTEVVLMRREERGKREGARPLPPPKFSNWNFKVCQVVKLL